MSKSKDAFRTISEVADWLDTPAHVLRFWESKFTQVKPVKRAGGRRYYRPNDMLLLGGLKQLLHEDGMTIKGAQKVLREKGVKYVYGLSQPIDAEDTPAPVEAEVIPEAPFTEVDTPEEDTVVPFAKPTPEAPVADSPVVPPAPTVKVEAPEEVAAAPADDEPAEFTDNPPTADDASLAAAEPEPHQAEAEPEPEHPGAPEAATLSTDDDAPASPEAPAQPQEDSRRQARFTFSSEEPGLPFDFPEPALEPAAETAAPEEATEDSSEETIPAASQPAESEPETSPALALPDAADLSKVSAKPGLLAYARQIRTTPPEDQATILAALPALKALADQLGQAPQ